MNTAADTMSEAHPQPRTGPSQTWPFYWSVRREMWEYRSLYIAPLAVAALILAGFAFSLTGLTHRAQVLAKLTPGQQAALLVAPYDIAAVAIIVTGVIVTVFYCLGALYNERRDRSVLFWKSLPVSDMTTVLSKAFVPLVVVPLIVFVVVVVLQLLMLLVHSAGRMASGLDTSVLWSQVNPFRGEAIVLLYGLATVAVWLSPVYGWLLLVSSWARRSPFLWAVLPPLAAVLVEHIAVGTDYIGGTISHRLSGGFGEAFDMPALVVAKSGHGQTIVPVVGLSQLDPVKFLTSVDVWLGVAFAVVFLAAAIWVRRYREPI